MKKTKSFNRKQFNNIRQKKNNNERSEILKTSLISVDADASPIISHIAEDTTDNMNPPEASATVTPPSSNFKHQQQYAEADSMDPALIFPHSNKPHETRKKTIAEESRQWESLFDPQYTFGSFQHGIAKPIRDLFYKGKWPLDEEDIMGIAVPTKNHKFKSKTLVEDNTTTTTMTHYGETATTTLLFPTVPSPTLPNLKQLKLHMNTTHLMDDSEEKEEEMQDQNGSSREIEILPCPSLSQFPKYNKKEENKQALWRDRLELLNTIQIMGFNKELNDGTQSNPSFRETAATRLQRQIKKKAEKMKRETLMYSSTEEEKDGNRDEQDVDSEFHRLHVAIQPDTLNKWEAQPPSRQDTSSLASLDDMYEKISFHAPNKQDIEKAQDLVEQKPEMKRKSSSRASFLFFAYGFLCPPLWILGALYVPNSNLQRTSASRNIDKKWKTYSRNAFFAFFVSVVAILVLILMLKPQAVGFRNSNGEGYQNGQRVVFDEDAVVVDPPVTV